MDLNENKILNKENFINTYKSIFPVVSDTHRQLEYQNKLLNKVTLTGKIAALDVAATLFEFADKAALTFNELQDELVNALLEENIKKLDAELQSKAQITIDILIRNLFERTADVGFLATDSVIVDFLITDTITLESMQKHLQEYVAKYSVYNEIIVFDTNGYARANINSNNHFYSSKDSLIQQTLKSDSYVEFYGHTDIFKSQKRTLVYLQKIESNGQNIGVLALCFKLEDELNRIFTQLKTEHEVVALADNNGFIASSSNIVKNIPQFKELPHQIFKNREVASTVKTNGYQGYFGIDAWYGICINSIQLFSKKKQNLVIDDKEINRFKKKSSTLLNDNLKNVIAKADYLVGDLNDVIINGELIASKKKMYILHPILDNLREISSSLLHTIKSSAYSLEQIISTSLIHDASTTAKLAIDIMDRNLYERANDCRWWALTPLFQIELSKTQPDVNTMHKTLQYINSLYTVYTNLFIYDNKGKIVASSNDNSILNTFYQDSTFDKTVANSNTQNYFVSEFCTTSLYDDKPTYIYNASICHKNSNVGGIGIVFDANIEFKAMLQESFPKTKNGFSLYVDQYKCIIASSSDSFQPLQILELDDKFFDQNMNNIVCEQLNYNAKEYIIASMVSKGYREYKTEDNYKNIVFAITFVETSSQN